MKIDLTFLNIWVSRSTNKRFLGTVVGLYQQIGNNLWCAKTKKGLRDKDYYDSKSIMHKFCDQFDMLEWMNENYQSAQVNEEFICI